MQAPEDARIFPRIGRRGRSGGETGQESPHRVALLAELARGLSGSGFSASLSTLMWRAPVRHSPAFGPTLPEFRAKRRCTDDAEVEAAARRNPPRLAALKALEAELGPEETSTGASANRFWKAATSRGGGGTFAL